MQQQQNQIASQAIGSGAFGGGREGVQRAELGALGLEKVGLAQQQAYNQAMQAFQNQQQLAAQTGLQAGQLGISGGQLQAQTGLSAGSQLGQLGQVQQNMAGTDIQRQIAAGGLQRQIAQAQLDASRQTQLQRSAEPLQRLEFLSNIYAAGPKSTSGITAATTPQSSPLAQSLGAGLAAYNAYGLNQATSNPAGNTALNYAPKTFNKGGIVDLAKVKKFNKGAMVSTEEEDQDYISPQMRSYLMTNPLAASLLQTRSMPGESEASATARGFGKGLEGQQAAALDITKLDAAVTKAKAKTEKGSRLLAEEDWRKIPALSSLPPGSIVQQKSDGTYTVQRTPKGEVDAKLAVDSARQQIRKIENLYYSAGKPTGFLESKIKKVGAIMGIANKDVLALDKQLGLFNADFLKAMRGVQVSGIEQEKFDEILPNINDDEYVFEAKVAAVKELLEVRNALLSGTVSRKDFSEAIDKVYGNVKSNASTSGSKKYNQEEDGSITINAGG
jgi:hypothetical protein